jgi:hypothetical protein
MLLKSTIHTTSEDRAKNAQAYSHLLLQSSDWTIFHRVIVLGSRVCNIVKLWSDWLGIDLPTSIYGSL